MVNKVLVNKIVYIKANLTFIYQLLYFDSLFIDLQSLTIIIVEKSNIFFLKYALTSKPLQVFPLPKFL